MLYLLRQVSAMSESSEVPVGTSEATSVDASERPQRGLAVLFPGQGSQRAGMATRLLSISRAAREVFAEADRALDISLSRLCVEGGDDELQDTTNTQPALLATSVAYFEHLKERVRELGTRFNPTLFAGHSLGQFSAAVASESVPLSDGLRLVAERGRVMKEWASRRPGGLATIFGLSKETLEEICDLVSDEESVAIAAHNAPDQFVISGDVGPLEHAMLLARERGARVIRLPISVPGHTPVMREAARQLGVVIDTTRFRAPSVPLVSNINGRLLTSAEDVRLELSDQIVAAVEWVRCMGSMVNEGVSTFVEVGPGRTLSNIARRFSENFRFLSAEDAPVEDLANLGIPLETTQPA
jgi:[acyl-carrier-protein] S-malonyltransferase